MTTRFRAPLAAIVAAAFIAALPLVLAARPAQPPAKELTAALQPYVEKHALAGAVVLVADKDRVLALETVGHSDVEAKTLMGKDAIVWIASMSKPIAAALLMLLVDDGKLKLDDPVEKYLPEFKGVWVKAEEDKDHLVLRRPKQAMTIRHLLSHTSGMRFSSLLEQPTLDRVSLVDGARSYALTPLESDPGTKYAYSNAGINTAGRIIEVVSGVPFEEVLQKRLLAPLGMKDTTFRPSEAQLKRLAKSYKPNAAKDNLVETSIGQLTYPLTDPRRQPMPAGGLFSTAQDVGNFCRMMLNGGTFNGTRILSEASVKEMTTRQTPQNVKESYGLGWSVNAEGFGHGGAFATNMWVDTKRGLVLVYLVQHNGFPADGAQALGAFQKAARERFNKG
jgi:CubicO group peptidase (beta-lactamase class C family)